MGEQHRLRESAAEAMEEALRYSTVGVVSGSDEDKWKGIGAGTLIRWKGRELVLTARHVIADTRVEDLRFLLPLSEVPANAERNVLLGLKGVPTSKLFPFDELRIHEVAADEKIDLAAIDITDSLLRSHVVRFLDVHGGRSTPRERKSMVSRGYPHDLIRATYSNEHVAFMFVHWTEIVEAPAGLDKFDPSFHFVAPFEGDGDAHPRGLSGSAMCFQKDICADQMWQANLEVAGITITYYETERLLKSVRRERVEDFLSSHFQ